MNVCVCMCAVYTAHVHAVYLALARSLDRARLGETNDHNHARGSAQRKMPVHTIAFADPFFTRTHARTQTRARTHELANRWQRLTPGSTEDDAISQYRFLLNGLRQQAIATVGVALRPHLRQRVLCHMCCVVSHVTCVCFAFSDALSI